jgi:hypothetical protein
MFNKIDSTLLNTIENLWQDISDIFNELDKMSNLFREDHNGTLRPKVDILSDRVSQDEINLWNALNELQRRIKELENENNKV